MRIDCLLVQVETFIMGALYFTAFLRLLKISMLEKFLCSCFTMITALGCE